LTSIETSRVFEAAQAEFRPNFIIGFKYPWIALLEMMCNNLSFLLLNFISV
jgi:hypothetical protein